MVVNVVQNERASRFEADVDGALCVLDYRVADGVVAIEHVGVPDAVAGRGIAAALMRRALDTARAEGWRVVSHCSYAAAYFAKHPAERDLLNPA